MKTGNQVTKIRGVIASAKSKCLVGRAVDVQWSPNTTLQSPFGTGTARPMRKGTSRCPGSAPFGSYYSIDIAKLVTGNTACRSTAKYGQLS
jgi:hypothetical protein